MFEIALSVLIIISVSAICFAKYQYRKHQLTAYLLRCANEVGVIDGIFKYHIYKNNAVFIKKMDNGLFALVWVFVKPWGGVFIIKKQYVHKDPLAEFNSLVKDYMNLESCVTDRNYKNMCPKNIEPLSSY